MEVTSNEDIENNTAATLSTTDSMELNTTDNVINITELSTKQNVILNSTNIVRLNLSYYNTLKEYIIAKELYNNYKRRLFKAQITIQSIVLVIILLILIIMVKNKHIK